MKKPHKQKVHHEPPAKKPKSVIPMRKSKETLKATVTGPRQMRPDSTRKPENLKNS